MSRERLGGLLALAWLALLALVVSWPAALGTELLGHPRCSAGCHAWLLWIAGLQLDQGLGLETELLFHPQGADLLRLYGSDLLSPLLLGPLAGQLTPWALFDIWVLLMLWANGAAAYALARGTGLGRAPAALTGTVFLAAPFFLHELLNGTSELVSAWPLPLFTLLWLRLLDRPGSLRGLLAGLVFALAGLGSAYAPFFLLLVALVMLGWRLVTRLEPVLLRARVVAMGVAGAVGAALLVPLALLHGQHGAGALHARRVGWSADSLPLPDSAADLLGFFTASLSEPPRLILQGDGAAYAYWTLGTATLGFVALVLAGLGWWRSRPRGPWLALLLAAAVLALGPYLVVAGELVQLRGQAVPLPALLVERLFPPWGVVSLHPYRFTAVAMLALAVLAGQGAAALQGLLGERGWSALRCSLTVAGLCLLVTVESLLHLPLGWPLPTTPPPAAAAWGWLEGQESAALVLLPFADDELGEICHGLLVQTQHGQPWSDGGMHFRVEPATLALYRENRLLAQLASSRPGPLPDALDTREGIEGLRASGFGWLVLQRQRYSLFEKQRSAGSERHEPAAVEAWLQAHLGDPAFDDGSVAVFAL